MNRNLAEAIVCPDDMWPYHDVETSVLRRLDGLKTFSNVGVLF